MSRSLGSGVRRPTLLNSCASAATAAEACFRIDGAPRVPRATRVVALDPAAVALVDRVAAQGWPGASFLSCVDRAGELFLRGRDGTLTGPADELAGADFVLMVATADDGAACASEIGMACTLRGITTAGLVVGSTGAAVTALRPHARVLLVTDDERDVEEILAAVGT
jgi:hypothetical protein